MLDTLRSWLRRTGRKKAADAPQAAHAPKSPEPPTTEWVLNVRPPMGKRPQVPGGVYEWALTQIGNDKDKACRIRGIWFWVSQDATLEARATLERMRRAQPLTRDALCALIERYRTPGSAIHVQRRIAGVSRSDSYQSAADDAFGETLTWGEIHQADRTTTEKENR